MEFKKIIPVFTDHMKHIQNAGLLIAKASGTYSYHWALIQPKLLLVKMISPD
jgi:hypothetical protein